MASTVKTLGVIIARAGSRGLPGKHTRPLCGKPVVTWTIEHARAARTIGRVVCSTDDPDVARIAADHLVPVIRRPASLATDDASVQDVLLHTLDHVSASGFSPDAIVLLYGNVPLREAGLIDRCVQKLADTRCCSVRTLVPVGKFHPGWMHRVQEDGVMQPLVPGSVHRRQELEPLWLHDGGVVVVSRAALEGSREHRDDPHAFFGVDRRGVTCAAGANLEIDTPFDLKLAEALLTPAQTTAVRMAS